MKKATVILGGGAALGFAHIGVLQVIEEKYNITRVIGTSMGALIGGLYASGMNPNEILNFGKEFKYYEFINPFNLDIKFQGLIDGSFIEKKINDKLGDKNIEDLKVKFSSVAFDINSRKTIIHNSGNVAQACRASAAIPYIFNPVSMGDMSLVDGGVEYPLPLLDIDDNEFVIAVNVLPKVIDGVIKTSSFDTLTTDKKKVSKRWYEIIIEALNCNQSFLVQQILKIQKPDIFIDCAIDTIGPTEFLKIEKLVELGKQKALTII